MPDWKPEIRRRLTGLSLALTRENATVEELAQDLDDCYAALISGGATEDEAYRATLAELSESESLARQLRRVRRQVAPEPIVLGTNRRTKMIADLWQDLRFGARMLAKNPGFTLLAVLTLSLGIGANTAIFSVVNAVLLRPLPYRTPADLVLVRSLHKAKGTQGESVSYKDFQDWKSQNRVFEDLAIFRPAGFSVTVGNDLELIRAANVSANFFQLLGVNAYRGRTFLPDEEKPSGEKAALLSHGLWQRLFGGDENLLGQRIRLNDQHYAVAGILPPDFKFPFWLEKAEIWTTTAMLPAGMMGRGARNFQAIARLKPGVSLQSAQADMTAIASRLEQDHPATNRDQGIALVSAHGELTKEVRRPLWLLFGVVLFVLLIACANVANLLLARALARQKELAIRAALGASGWRITRQLLTESLLLSLAGGALGLVFAAWGIPFLLALSPPTLPRINAVGLNGPVLGFTCIVSLLTGILFGLTPAWKAARPDLNEALKDGGKSSASAVGTWLQGSLVVGEIAIALVLLIGAGLLINSFIRLNGVEIGFDPENVLTAQLSLPEKDYRTGNERIAFLQRVREQVGGLPGVRAVSFASSLPFSGGITTSFSIKGREQPANEQPTMTGLYFVMPDYFYTIGMRLLQGRQFTEADDKRGPGAAIVNEAFAQQFFPNENPLGQRISSFANRDEDSPIEFEIVGIVGNVRAAALSKDPTPEVFVPYRQAPQTFGQLAVRTEGDALSLAGALRQRIRSLDAAQTVLRLNTVENQIADSIMPQRFNLLLLSIFAGIGLALTLAGIHGVMSYFVTGSARDIGIRMALGAQTGDVLRLVLGRGARLTGLGIVLGLAGAVGVTRLMTTLLFGVSATDPLTFVAISILVVCVALLACYLPARRATQIDPLVALRAE